MKYFFGISVLLVAGIAWYVFRNVNTPEDYSTGNAILGIRGFRHSQLFASRGLTERYKLDVGEEFKILWIIHVLARDGQIKWRGPAGIGEGGDVIKASGEEITGLKIFTATEPGVAELTLTAVNPGDSMPETNKIIVNIQ